MGFRLTGNMLRLRRSALLFLAAAAVALLVTGGCAAVDQNVNFLYQPTPFGSGGSGDLYLSAGDQSASAKGKSVEWVIGEIKDSDGENKGRIISARSPADMVADAFAQEFKSAGYNVVPVDALPANVGKGIRLESVTVQLDEVKGLVKLETTCKVKVKLEPWRNGVALNKLNYENTYTASTLVDRDLFLLKSLQTTMQELMARVVREVTVMLEK
ncbi:MAG TPA: hypothetical protein VF799_10030 [Geobacteraceae bacterium]